MDTPDKDNSVNNFEFEFSSVQFYGEDGGGAWIVTISDSNNPDKIGELNSLELTVFGSSDDNNDQYIFTDEFVAIDVVAEDNSGEDWINTSAVTSDVVVDLSSFKVNFLDGQGVVTVTQDVSQLSSLKNIVAGDGDDLLIGTTGASNILNGGRGTDTVAYADLLELGMNYSVVFNSDHVLVTNISTLAVDMLYSVEVLNFGGVLHHISTTKFITNLDTTIQADLTNYIDNVTLHYYKNQLIDGVLTPVDTGVSTQVVDGSIAIGQSILFDSVKLSISDFYTGGSMGMGIAIDDAVAVEKHAVEATEESDIVPWIVTAGGHEIEPNTSAWHAADMNNDDTINVNDAVLLYRHIVDLDSIDTFDLIDGAGNRVTSLDADSTDAANWTIVANGDITQSGLWDTDYTVSMDIV
jgi:hypothetical protein